MERAGGSGTRGDRRARRPSARWFVWRAFEGRGSKLALVDAALATIIALFAAVLWRVSSGSHGGFEAIVPMLGTGLRWSVALPIAWGALGAVRADREAGFLDLAMRRGIGAREWLVGRAIGAGALVAIAVGGPMAIVAIVLAGFGGGVEGSLARASLLLPSIVVALTSGAVFGVGGVVLGALFPSRAIAIGVLVAMAAVGALVDLAIPGLVGALAHQLVSPFRAMDDLQAALFDAPGALGRGIAAAFAIAVFTLLGLHVAALGFAQQRAQDLTEGS